jgi:molecular chaperone DnaK
VIGGRKRHSILVDITPHTFSTTVVRFRDTGRDELICMPIIPRNTPLPASKSEMVATLCDEQEQVKVEAYQGEGRLPEQNTFIGDFMVEGLSKVPAGNPIVIHFDLDLNGLLKVTATEKVTGLAKTVHMDTRGHKVLDLDEARRNIASLIAQPEPAPTKMIAGGDTAGPADQAGPEKLLASAKDLRKRGEALLQKNITPEDGSEVRQLIHDSTLAIKDSDWKRLADRNHALSDLLFYLEE